MKFLEMFKKLELNIPFLEAISQLPNYAKFLSGQQEEVRGVCYGGTY